MLLGIFRYRDLRPRAKLHTFNSFHKSLMHPFVSIALHSEEHNANKIPTFRIGTLINHRTHERRNREYRN